MVEGLGFREIRGPMCLTRLYEQRLLVIAFGRVCFGGFLTI